MKTVMAVVLLAAITGDAAASAFHAYANVTPYDIATAPPAAVLEDNNATGLPSDGKYSAAIDYATGPITVGNGVAPGGSGKAAIDVDLRAGTFSLGYSVSYPCYITRSISSCANPGDLYTTVGFTYTDTLSIQVPGAAASDVGYVDFAFEVPVRYFTSFQANSGRYVNSSISLANDSLSEPSLASVSTYRICGPSCGVYPADAVVSLSSDPARGSFASWNPVPPFQNVPMPISSRFASRFTASLPN